MRLSKLICLVLTVSASFFCSAQEEKDSSALLQQKRINFYIVNQIRGLDLFSRTVLWRAKLQSAFKQQLVVIVARSSEQMSREVRKKLNKHKAMIGTIWFDSHGRYANGYSSFMLGKEEFSFRTIKDTLQTKALRSLSHYCDEGSNVVIGSCYGGATFERQTVSRDTFSRMNGDSLMIGLAELLPGANIFGAESWVMTKPGIFKHSYALSGYPLQKKFKDEIFEPVWQRMGIWNHYSTQTQKLQVVNSVALNRSGGLACKQVNYLSKGKSRQKLNRNLRKLQPGLYKTT
jgi:hypothetical protein